MLATLAVFFLQLDDNMPCSWYHYHQDSLIKLMVEVTGDVSCPVGRNVTWKGDNRHWTLADGWGKQTSAREWRTDDSERQAQWDFPFENPSISSFQLFNSLPLSLSSCLSVLGRQSRVPLHDIIGRRIREDQGCLEVDFTLHRHTL